MSTTKLTPPGGLDDPGGASARMLNVIIHNKLCDLGLLYLRRPVFTQCMKDVAVAQASWGNCCDCSSSEFLALIVVSAIDRVASDRGIMIASRRRQLRMTPLKEADSLPGRNHDPVQELIDAELMEAFKQALTELPPHLSATLTMHMNGHPIREIAEAQEVATSTAAAWLHRVRGILSVKLKEYRGF